MKKHRIEKLKINRETLRQLGNGSLRQAVAGNSSPSQRVTCCSDCSVTCTACTTGCNG